jgi:hypothetical protein
VRHLHEAELEAQNVVPKEMSRMPNTLLLAVHITVALALTITVGAA